MKILVALKPEQYELPHHAYAVLAEIDWRHKRVERSLILPTASFRHREAFMAPLCGGICIIGLRIFIGMWNFVVEVDYRDFRIVNAVSSPWMADIHGLTTDGQRIWMASTAVTALLGLDADTLETVWRWGPDEPILHWRPPGLAAATLLPSWWQRLISLVHSPDSLGDFRHIHKSRSPHYRHHLNDVRWHDGELFAITKGWFASNDGAVIRVNPLSGQAAFLVPPGGINGAHDGEFVGDRLILTESGAHGVALVDPDGRVEHRPLSLPPESYFIRGLCRAGDGFLVGFSRLRHSSGNSWIVAYDSTFEGALDRLEITGFHPQSPGTVIHALALSPGP